MQSNIYVKMEKNDSVDELQFRSIKSVGCAAKCSSSDETCIGMSVEKSGNGACHLHPEDTSIEDLTEVTHSAKFVTWLRPGKWSTLGSC